MPKALTRKVSLLVQLVKNRMPGSGSLMIAAFKFFFGLQSDQHRGFYRESRVNKQASTAAKSAASILDKNLLNETAGQSAMGFEWQNLGQRQILLGRAGA